MGKGSKKARWRPRVSLRVLLLVVSGLCLLLGLWLRPVWVQRNTVSNLAGLGVTIRPYNYTPSMAERPHYPSGADRPWRPPWWVIQRLGPDFFAAVTSVNVSRPQRPADESPRQWLREVVAELRRLPRLKDVSFWTVGSTGETWQGEELAKLKTIASLQISGHADAAMIAPLAGLPRLTYLEFDGSLDEPDYRALAQIASLEQVGVESFTARQQALLKELRPDIELWAHFDYGD